MNWLAPTPSPIQTAGLGTKGDLPLTGTDADGNTVYYAYYVVEHGVTNCTTAYENNGGIASGTIVIKNTESENPAYTLPETGGAGTTPYTMEASC